MAQTGMREIRRRIRSINNTRQITRCMELVAAAKLRKARTRYEATQPYFKKVISTIQDIADYSKGIRHPFLKEREVKKELYIVITSDRGLCGGYNANLLREVLGRLERGVKYSFIVVGRKGRDYLRSRGYHLKEEFLHISDKPRLGDARNISRVALRLYTQGEVDRVNLAYTTFISTLSQEPRIITLLPVQVDQEVQREEHEELMTYEPSAEEVIDLIVPGYIQSAVYGALVEASASEQAARRVAMESATDSASDMIEELQLSFNRARQEIITREISEIVGGAEALK